MDLEAWAVSMMERHNRKSHLAPQISPAAKALLRSDGTNVSTPPSVSNRTPITNDVALSKSGIANSYATSSSRPSFPARTSSAHHLSSGYQAQSMVNLPIRPAPPPAGPLPQVPRKNNLFRDTSSSLEPNPKVTRRPPDATLGYAGSDGPRYY